MSATYVANEIIQDGAGKSISIIRSADQYSILLKIQYYILNVAMRDI